MSNATEARPPRTYTSTCSIGGCTWTTPPGAAVDVMRALQEHVTAGDHTKPTPRVSWSADGTRLIVDHGAEGRITCTVTEANSLASELMGAGDPLGLHILTVLDHRTVLTGGAA